MIPMLLALPGAETLAARMRAHWPCEPGGLKLHRFPDGECCPVFDRPVAGRDVVLMAVLEHPDATLFALYLCACVARELGARSVGLGLPYLPYMRQDARFTPGQGITSLHVAHLLGGCADWLATVDPHLHRHPCLEPLFGIPCAAVNSAPAVACWLVSHVAKPMLVGPDAESEQWVGRVAALADCPHIVLRKERLGDRQVAVSAPDRLALEGYTPVLLDDIVSSGHTMAQATAQLRQAGAAAPVCIVVHALFAGDAEEVVRQAGPACIVSCNTLPHGSNQIDIIPLLAAEAARLCRGASAALFQP